MGFQFRFRGLLFRITSGWAWSLKTEHSETRSTGTVHTPAKARLTSAAIWRISMNECLVTHFPYLQIVTNLENNPCIQTLIRIAAKI